MAHFYGTVNGQAKTKASRRGSKNSGLRTIAASWQGAVQVELINIGGTDHARVSLVPWQGRGTTRVLYEGPVSGAPVAAKVA